MKQHDQQNTQKPLKLMLDTNIYDKLDSDVAVNESLKKLIHDQRIELITTHIQEDELAMAPEMTGAESGKIPTEGFILGVSKLGEATIGDGSTTKKVPTAGAVWGVSKWGEATWGDGSGQGISVDDVKTDKGNHAKDALIATTASHHADYLITEDKRLIKKLKQSSAKCVVIDFEGLKNLLASL